MRVLLSDMYDPAGDAFYYFTAVFERFSKTEEGSNVVMLTQVHAEGKYVADHCWIHRSKALKHLNPAKGDVLEFLAVVSKYPKPKDFVHIRQMHWEYGLEKVREIKIKEKRNGASDNRHLSGSSRDR